MQPRPVASRDKCRAGETIPPANAVKLFDTPAGWLAYAVNEFYKDRFDLGLERIIEAKAETAKNNRAWNLYGNADDETENMDVWISGLAKTYTGYIEIGAYLSDIWQTGATPYKEHIFAIEYSRNN